MMIGLATFAGDSPQQPGPLDRLRERSAEARWQQQRHQWFSPSDPGPDGSPWPPADPPVYEDMTRSHSTPTESPSDSTESAPATLPESAPGFPSSAATADPVAPSEAVAPEAPHDTRRAIGDPQSDGLAVLRPAPADRPQPEPHDSQAVILPDFLEGAGPQPVPTLPEKQLAHQRPGTAGFPGSSRAAVQNQTVQPMADRTRGMLRRISEISPFFDYDPDGGDPCQGLCPVPDSQLCESDDYLCPEVEAIPASGSAERNFAHMNFFWAASNVFHNPLYFEDPALERYGHVHGHDALQPFYSVARFGGQLVGLPYQMALCPVHDRVYPLGYYRPGDPAPRLIYQPPFNARAAAVAAGVYSGLFFLVP